MFWGERGSGTVPAIAAAVFALGLWVAAPVVQAAEPMSKDAVAARIAEVYGVEVLRVQEVTVDGRAAYAITVMNPGGNSNAAFQVNTLLADAATGNLLPVFRHRPAGYDPPGAATYESKVDGLALRRRSFAE